MKTTPNNPLNDDALAQALIAAFEEVVAPEEAKSEALAFIEQQRLKPENRRQKPRNLWAKRAAIYAAAACFILLAIGFGVTAKPANQNAVVEPQAQAAKLTAAQPAAYVGIDVNPSLELEVSESEVVLGATAINKDGENVLANMNIVGKPYSEALATVLNTLKAENYLTPSAFVEVSVASDSKTLSQSLESISNGMLATTQSKSKCVQTDLAHHNAAKNAGMGMGRYRAAQELIALDNSVTLQDCKNLTMAQLQTRIDACKEGHGGAGTDGSTDTNYDTDHGNSSNPNGGASREQQHGWRGQGEGPSHRHS